MTGPKSWNLIKGNRDNEALTDFSGTAFSSGVTSYEQAKEHAQIIVKYSETKP
jgi:hypothetical protein